MNAKKPESTRNWLARIFRWVEDVVYVGLGVLLAGCALTLLGSGALEFWHHLLAGTLPTNIVKVLDHRLTSALLFLPMHSGVHTSAHYRRCIIQFNRRMKSA